MKTLWWDIRFSIRFLTRHPGIAVASITCLSLGLGACITVFTIINTLLLKPLPFYRPAELVWIHEKHPLHHPDTMSVSYMNYLDYKKTNTVFSKMAAFTTRDYNLEETNSSQRIITALVTPDFFDVLGVKPILGRTFVPNDINFESPGMAVISENLWKKRFNQDKNIIGTNIQISGLTYSIIGVMPQNADIPAKTDVWTLVYLDPEEIPRDTHFLWVIARMKPTHTINDATNQLYKISDTLQEKYPDTNQGIEAIAKPLRSFLIQTNKSAIVMIASSVMLVLIISCLNVAHLILSKGTFRIKEYAVKTAFGAKRYDLFRQMLVDGITISLISSFAGLILSMWFVDYSIPSIASETPRFIHFSTAPVVIIFTFFLALFTGVLVGIVPIAHLPRKNLNLILKESGKNLQEFDNQMLFRNGLIIGEIALATILTIHAGVTLNGYNHLKSIDPGFNGDNVLTMKFMLPELKYSSDYQIASFYHRLLTEVEKIPGVIHTGLNQQIPLYTRLGWEADFRIKNQTENMGQENPHANFQIVSPGYFACLEIPILSGCSFTEENHLLSPKVAIVNRKFADHFWPNSSAVGKQFTLETHSRNPEWLTIIGVVGDVHHRGVDSDPLLDIYVSCYQYTNPGMTLLLKTESTPYQFRKLVENAIHRCDSLVPLYNVLTMSQVAKNSLQDYRSFTGLALIYTFLALVLAGVGVYGTSMYHVQVKIHEIGIRIAFGAQRANIIQTFIRRSSILILIGLVMGMIGALCNTWWSPGSSLEPDLKFISYQVLLIAFLTSYLFAAAYFPIRKASRINPVEILRYE